MEHESLTLIKRNTEWFDSIKDEFKTFWENVIEMRNNKLTIKDNKDFKDIETVFDVKNQSSINTNIQLELSTNANITHDITTNANVQLESTNTNITHDITTKTKVPVKWIGFID